LRTGTKIALLFGLILLILPFELLAQPGYGWTLSYLSNYNNHWAHLGSKDTVAIASLKFMLDDSDDPRTFYLKQLNLRPLTNSTAAWFVKELRLYLEKGGSQFSADDSLICWGLSISIPKQSEPDTSISFNFRGDSLRLVDNRKLYLVAIMDDWSDEDPENLEIDTTASGPYGIWFSLKIYKEELTVSPIVAHSSIDPLPTNQSGKAYFQALNLPVTICNNLATAIEDDSVKLNMFFPRFRSVNGYTSSKRQRIDDLSFYADVYLPIKNTSVEFSLKSASFEIGFDNRILQLQSITLGDIWGEDTDYWVADSMTQIYDEDVPNYSIIRYDAVFNNSQTINTKYSVIDSSSVARLGFKLVSPGISPIFFRNIEVTDRWGITYHDYRVLQNYAVTEEGATSERYDAWAKYILGDFTFTGGGQVSTAGICDGQVTWEDISLFAKYLWLNSSSSSWYERFDIGSAESHSPSVLIPDDTTNFYDLMIIGVNYRRTKAGYFGQKPVSQQSGDIVIRQEETILPENQYAVRLNLSQVANLTSAHLQWRFDPGQMEFVSATPGDWVEQSGAAPLVIIPQHMISRGIVDVNFIALNNVLRGEGEVIELIFNPKQSGTSEVQLQAIDLRDKSGESLEYRWIDDPDETTTPNDFILLNNYPNPFNAITIIGYTVQLKAAGNYRLDVLDISGSLIVSLANGFHQSGYYQLVWDGKNSARQPVASGVYFLRLSNQKVNETKKLMLLR
jgi:hypothetical protein